MSKLRHDRIERALTDSAARRLLSDVQRDSGVPLVCIAVQEPGCLVLRTKYKETAEVLNTMRRAARHAAPGFRVEVEGGSEERRSAEPTRPASGTIPMTPQEMQDAQAKKSSCCGAGEGFVCRPDCPRLVSAERLESYLTVRVAERMGATVEQVRDAENWDRNGWERTDEAMDLWHEFKPLVARDFGACFSHMWIDCPLCLKGKASPDASVKVPFAVGQGRVHPSLGQVTIWIRGPHGLWGYLRPDGQIGWVDEQVAETWPLAERKNVAATPGTRAFSVTDRSVAHAISEAFARCARQKFDEVLTASVISKFKAVVGEPAFVATSAKKSRRTVDTGPTSTDVRTKNRELALRVAVEPPGWAYPAAWTLAVGAVLEAYNNHATPVVFDVVYWKETVAAALRRYHDARLGGLLPERALVAAIGADVVVLDGQTYDELACEAYERGRPGPGGMNGTKGARC